MPTTSPTDVTIGPFFSALPSIAVGDRGWVGTLANQIQKRMQVEMEEGPRAEDLWRGGQGSRIDLLPGYGSIIRAMAGAEYSALRAGLCRFETQFSEDATLERHHRRRWQMESSDVTFRHPYRS